MPAKGSTSSGKSSGHVSRSSINGRFVTDKYAKTHPKTTETQKKTK